MTDFEKLLTATLERAANPATPSGLEQRLLARLEQAATPAPALFMTTARIAAPRSLGSTWTALGLHAAAILLIAIAVAHHIQVAAPHPTALAQLTMPAPPPPMAPRREAMAGGGGQKGPSPVTQGHLPKVSSEQLLPPKAPPLLAPKLAVEPTVVAQPDLKLADNRMPDLGVPNSSLKGFSMGNGSGGGVGSGTGNGIGPGSGGNTGGGVMHVGGSVHAPIALVTPDPEFSEEARKAKFSGNVEVYLIVDEHGNPTHVRVARDVGMGLGEKAVEAVRQYKFKPAMQNGKPVKVDMYVDVEFRIF